MKQFITEAQRLQKLAGINEVKIIPQKAPRPLKGSISPEEWKAIGNGFTTDILNPPDDIIFETPQGFHFTMDTKTPRLSAEIRYNDYDPGLYIEEWMYDQVNELEQQLNAAGYELEIQETSRDMMLYIPV